MRRQHDPSQLRIWPEEGLEALHGPAVGAGIDQNRKVRSPKHSGSSRLSSLSRSLKPGPRISGPEDAGKLLIELIGKKEREHFVALHLDTRHVAVGSLNAALVHPREVYKAAILANSAAIICGHNHPSGELDPSAEDLALHKRIRAASELLGIDLLDFLVVSATRYQRA